MDVLDEISENWRWCDELTIVQAALLIVGIDPTSKAGASCERTVYSEQPKGYAPAKIAISDALQSGKIRGKVEPVYQNDSYGSPVGVIPGSVDVEASVVSVDSLKEWLVSRGFRKGFFFPALEPTDYLDPGNDRYAPKLAAAVQAWKAVTDPNGKHPKQALMKWLRENAATFGLTDDEGRPNETGIEEVAKVANWKPGGGAPKTPSE